MSIPCVTFVVASYNYEKYLPQTLESLVEQWEEKEPFEILIVDDGSSDNSLTIANDFSYKYPFIRVVTHNNHRNLGLIATLKLAVNEISSGWIAFLESDDLSKTGAVREIINTIKEGTAGLFFFDIEPLTEKSDSLAWFNSYVPRVRNLMLSRGANKFGINLGCDILWENLIPTFSCAVVKASLLKQCSFDCPVNGWIDWFIWIQVTQKTKVRFIDKKLVQWRLHTDSQNNKKKFWTYIYQYSAFRNSVLQMLRQMDIESKASKIAFLELPSAIPLGMRILKMARYVGIKQVIKQIYRRLTR